MKAIDRLTEIERTGIRLRVQERIKLFTGPVRGADKRVLLVGDRPAPDAPDDDRFHFVPFGAEHHSSLWLNLLLTRSLIPERELAWVNAYDRHGNPTDPAILKHPWKAVYALGGNAAKWLKAEGKKHGRVPHPQAWKRFHSKEPYPLIDFLKLDLGHPIIMT